MKHYIEWCDHLNKCITGDAPCEAGGVTTSAKTTDSNTLCACLYIYIYMYIHVLFISILVHIYEQLLESFFIDLIHTGCVEALFTEPVVLTAIKLRPHPQPTLL